MAVDVKICGLTLPADAVAAAELGATYLGVVYAGGPRRVGDDAARAIVQATDLPVFGVFGTQPVEDILRRRDRTGIAGAQLHGAYTREDAALLRSAGLRVWRVVRLAGEVDLDRIAEAVADADAVLIEPKVPHGDGGTGTPLAPTLARLARERLVGRTMVLAGGLTPETVGEAVALVRPEVVDVSSGVEFQPGTKDHRRIAKFVEAARGALASS